MWAVTLTDPRDKASGTLLFQSREPAESYIGLTSTALRGAGFRPSTGTDDPDNEITIYMARNGETVRLELKRCVGNPTATKTP